MNFKFWTWGKTEKTSSTENKNKRLTTDIIRIRVNRLINNTAVEIGVFDANLTRDKYNNTIIFNEENNIREELPNVIDSLVSDVLYKIENRGLSLPKQMELVNTAIDKQEDLLSKERKGKIRNDEESSKSGKLVKINLHTEKTKLRMLKCVKYTIENKKGDGFFESIEQDGTRSLTYLIRDGELIPYWHKTPNSEGEPVVLVPDIVQRKKFYKEASDEAINDFNESQDTMWRGVLGVITKALFVIAFLGVIVWTIYLARWSADLRDDSLQPTLDKLQVENERIRQLCSSQVANQIENNGVLIEYAKQKLLNEQSNPPTSPNDIANPQI